MEERFVSNWEGLCETYESQGYGALSQSERLWFNVRALIDSIQNGGMISYFYNSAADHLGDCLAALRQLRASNVQPQVLRMCSLFPDGVPATVDGRNNVINNWNEERIEGTLDEIDEATEPWLADLERRLSKAISNNFESIGGN